VRAANNMGGLCLASVAVNKDGATGFVGVIAGGEVVKTEIFTIDGVLLNQLQQGVNIVRTTYANGAVYVNTNINFYLRRQDPYGIYGLKRVDNGSDASSNGGIVGDLSSNGSIVGDFIVNGVAVELPDIDYKTEENYTVCEN
jgi:hypothetical protein